MYFITTVLLSAVLVYSVGGKEMKEGKSDTSLLTANRQIKRNYQVSGGTYRDWQWYLKDTAISMNVESAWRAGYTGKGVLVAVVDDGVNMNHYDLKSNFNLDSSYDFLKDRNISRRYSPGSHGTNCAGIIAGGDNTICGVGIAFGAQIASIRLYDDNTKSTDQPEARALRHKRNLIDIYSNSWGPGDMGWQVEGPGPRLTKVLEEGTRLGRHGKGSIFVFASGNGGITGDSCAFSGYVNSIHTIAISAVNWDGSVPSFTEQCAAIMAVTYGQDMFTYGQVKAPMITTKGVDGQCTEDFSGTSSSTALASGIIALALEANPDLTWRDVQHLIARSSKPLVPRVLATRSSRRPTPHWAVNAANLSVSSHYGFGLMDARKMVGYAKNWTSVPEQLSCEVRLNVSSSTGQQISWTKNVQLSVFVSKHDCGIRYLEHVQVQVDLTFPRRGYLEMSSVSPSGTRSKLLYPRVIDSITGFKNFTNWTVTSLHYWGENPVGNWRIIIRNTKQKRRKREVTYAEPCGNIDGDQNCIFWRSYCKISSYLQRNCAKTCGKCPVVGHVFSLKLILYGTRDDPLTKNSHVDRNEKKFTAASRSGPSGLSSAVGLVGKELNIVIVHVPILGQHTEDEAAADWDQLQKYGHVTNAVAQFMAVIRSGPPGLSVASHVLEGRNIVIVHAPIHRLQMGEGTAADWDELQNHGNVTHLDAQLKEDIQTGFSGLSQCSPTCGNETKQRYRLFTGNEITEIEKICGSAISLTLKRLLPVHGGYSQWSVWSQQCSRPCGRGTQYRYRSCTNPRPAHRGRGCSRLGPNRDSRTCNTHHCPVHGGYLQWSSWSKCSQSCEGGTQHRNRSCTNPRPAYRGRGCSRLGLAKDSRTCNTQRCPVDGGYSDWSPWSNCSVTCGNGTQQRIRSCTNPPPAYSGKQCGGLSQQTRKCFLQMCLTPDLPIHGGYSQWSSWSLCSRSCDGGTQHRNRSCANPPPANGGRDCNRLGRAAELRKCNTFGCPVDGRYSQWSRWSACSKSCDGGIKYRSRSCTNPPPANRGQDCWRLGSPVLSQICNTHKCPGVNVQIPQSALMKMRFGGFRSCKSDRAYYCTVFMAVTRSGPTGLSVVGLVAAELKIVIVHAQIQDPHTEDGGVADLDQLRNHGHVTYLDVQANRSSLCLYLLVLVHGGYSQWSSWSQCSQSCGGGMQHRNRSCTNPPPANGGRDCSRLGRATELRKCNTFGCPVHGGYSQWSSWSRCSRSCAGGAQRRSRSCTNPPPANGGRDCSGQGEAMELRKCNNHDCPVHGGYSQWSSWSQCSKLCDGGTQHRNRSCTNPKPAYRGSGCSRLGLAKDSRTCNTQRCPVHGGYSQWSSWSQCSQSCDGGTKQRNRSCTNPPPAKSGKDCNRLGRATASRKCNTFGCPVHGGYSQWSRWNSCSKSCGGGFHNRHRSCTKPRPKNGGRDCSRLGQATESKRCNVQRCPEGWHFDGEFKLCGRVIAACSPDQWILRCKLTNSRRLFYVTCRINLFTKTYECTAADEPGRLICCEVRCTS
ncbi:uncharacterized protein LOC144665100 [Oculina patagonica]